MNAVTALRPDTNRDRFTYDHITVEPVTPTIGAEISGVDLREPITPGLATACGIRAGRCRTSR